MGKPPAKIKFALAWSFVQRCSQQGLRFLATLVMVRLLTPDDYGLLGMTLIFAALSKKLVDAGFSSALVQKKEIDELDCHTAFYTNLLMSVLIYAVLYVIAPWVADFYTQPILTPLIRISSLNVVIAALSAVQLVLYTRDLDFKTPTRISIIALVIGAAVGIVAAFNGYGVWSLVAQTTVSNIVKCVLVWFLGSYRPALKFSRERLWTLFGFGSKVSLLSIVETVFQHLHDAVIGKLYPVAILGLYGRGKSLVEFGMMNVVQPINLVVYPALSRVQDSTQQLKALHLRALSLLGFLIVPTMILLACLAEPLVQVLLTNKWIGCVPYLQLLCLLGALIPLRKACTTTLKAINKVETALKLQFMSRLASLVTLAFSFRLGIAGMVCGEALVLAVFGLVYFNEVGKKIDTRVLEQVGMVSASVLPACFAAGSVLLCQYYLDTSTFLIPKLAGLLVLGAAVYLAACQVVGHPSLKELVVFLKHQLAKRNQRSQTA